MGAALAFALAELRTRGWALVAIALLVGVGSGVTTALVAGAERSTTVADRFRSAQAAADLLIQPDVIDPQRLAELRADPAIDAAAPLAVVFARVQGSDTDIVNESQVRVAVDGTYGVDVDRPQIVAGEPLDHGDPRAVEISESVARTHHLEPGDPLVLESLSPAQIVSAIFEGEPAGVPSGPELDLVVRSVVRPPNETLGLTDPGGILLTKALWEEVGVPVGFDEPAATGLGGFDNVLPATAAEGRTAEAIAAARTIFGDDDELFVEESAQEAAGVDELGRVAGIALFIAAATAGVATVIVGAQAISRHTGLSSTELPVLAAIGMTKRARVGATALPFLIVVAAASVVATIVAIALSGRFPTGELAALEPDPGLRPDGPVLAIGVVLTALVIVAFALAGGWRAHVRPAPGAGSRLARVLSRGRVVPATAMRLATSRGVPIRPAFGGAIAALAGVAAAATFGASLDRFVDQPLRDGWAWDAEVGMGDQLDDEAAVALAGELASSPVVDGVLLARIGTLGTGADRDDVQAFGLADVEGDVSLTVIDGRLPAEPGEVAVGLDTADRYGAGVGDRIEVDGVQGVVPLRITGTVRFPVVGSDNAADGLALTLEGLTALAPPSIEDGAFGFPTAFVDWTAGVTDAEGRAALGGDFSIVHARVPSSDVTSLERVDGMAPAIAAGLAVLGAVAVAHALAVAVRRQRRDLGVLRGLGFVRRQIRAAVAVQALVYGTLGVVVGVPLGVATGRWSWRRLAQGIGTFDDPLTPGLLVLAVPATLALLALVAALPARAAARTSPAVALRSE